MNLTADISGEKFQLDIKQDGSRVVAKIDGRSYELEERASQPGVYLLLSDGHVYECRVNHVEAQRDAMEITVGNHSYAVTLADPKRLRGTESFSAHADGTAQIIAPMPGKVVRVLVEEGAEVEAGAGVVVVEAMKMQNELKSPKTGKVTAISVAVGATVNAGDVLAIVE